jgi:HEAT repeat protein
MSISKRQFIKSFGLAAIATFNGATLVNAQNQLSEEEPQELIRKLKNLLEGVFSAGDEDKKKCKNVVNALLKIGAPAVPELINALEDGNELVRMYVADALGGIGTPAAPAVPALIEAMRYPGVNSMELRGSVIKALSKIGSPAVPLLRKALKDKYLLVQIGAADALGEIGAIAAPAVPALIKALEDKYVDVRISVIRALGKIGAPAAPAVPALLEELKKPANEEMRAEVKFETETAFVKIGVPAVPYLEKIGQDSPERKEEIQSIIKVINSTHQEGSQKLNTAPAMSHPKP